MSVLLRDLNELSPELARFGMEGTRVFAGMAKQARSLGLSTKDIFDVSEQLDTFQGAAEIVGRMNAQFGMQLNSVELMKASHEERVDILRQEFRLQGRSFQALDRRQKQMLASILGRDVKTVAKLFGDQMDITAFQEDVGKADPLDKFTKFADRATVLNEQAFDKVIESLGGVQKVNEFQINLLKTMQGNMGSVVSGLLGLASISFAAKAAGKFNKLKDITKAAPKPGSMVDDVIKAAPKMKPTGLFDQFGKPIMKEVGKEATEVAAKATGSVVKNVAKTGLKAGLKALPVIGLGLGIYDAIGRVGRGDFVGAGLDIVAGTAALVPGLGTGASLAISGAAVGTNMVRDRMAASDPAKAVPNMESAMANVESMNTASASSGDTIQLNIQELVVKSSVEVDGDVLWQKTQKYFNTALNPTMAN